MSSNVLAGVGKAANIITTLASRTNLALGAAMLGGKLAYNAIKKSRFGKGFRTFFGMNRGTKQNMDYVHKGVTNTETLKNVM